MTLHVALKVTTEKAFKISTQDKLHTTQTLVSGGSSGLISFSTSSSFSSIGFSDKSICDPKSVLGSKSSVTSLFSLVCIFSVLLVLLKSKTIFFFALKFNQVDKCNSFRVERTSIWNLRFLKIMPKKYNLHLCYYYLFPIRPCFFCFSWLIVQWYGPIFGPRNFRNFWNFTS